MKTVIILSWWLDSTTLLYRLINEWKEIYALSLDYWQKHLIELQKAKQTCKKLWINHKILKIHFLNEITENSLTRKDIEVPEWHYESESMKNTVVYNRNPIMANIALSYALTIWADEIALWIHSWDHHIYEDCRPEALEALQKTADIWNKWIKFIAPYLNTNKWGIVKEWLKLWVDYSLTHTCYKWWEIACWKCWSCQERLEAFEKNGEKDSIAYM